MNKLAHILAIVLMISLATTLPARADPISITLAIAGVISTTEAIIASVSLVISLAASFLLRPKQKSVGQKLDITIGGDNPLSIGVGLFTTGGQLAYVNSWGVVDKTPNAYLTQVIELTDVPIDGMNGLYVSGERVVIAGAAQPQGTPVSQYNVAGKDHMWVKFYDGTQTVADAFLTGTVSTPERPWTNEFIGRGRSYAIVTMLSNREVFNSVPTFRFELRGIKCYDPRLDTTVGGNGSHREDQPSTWVWTENQALITRAILRGVRYGNEWVYGGQTIAKERLPTSAWIAAANEGFKAGGEIQCNIEPVNVIEALMQAAGGRLAENGGTYKPRMMTPGAAVWAFTDDDVIITEGQQLTPFDTLQNRHNKVEASYPEPAEGWTMKPAPPRIDAAAIAREQGRELTLPIDYTLVHDSAQVQQLMSAALKETQRQRQHRFSLPPIAWLFEPGDTIAWTSTRNGYVSKLFRIEEIAGRRSFIQTAALREVDPTDYDWSPADLIAVTHNPITILRPPAQAMTGFQVFPAAYESGLGEGFPSIEIRYDNDLSDVRAIRVQVRLASNASIAFDGEVPYDRDTDRIILNGVFLPDTDYEVRAKYQPFSARKTNWSAWLAVRTPDTRFITGVADNSIDLDKLNQDVLDLVSGFSDRLRDLDTQSQNLHRVVGEMQLGDWNDRQAVRTELQVSFDNTRAGYTQDIFAATGVNSVLAGRIETVEVAIDDPSTGLNALGVAQTVLATDIQLNDDAIAIQSSDITALQASLTLAESSIVGNASALGALDTRVTGAEGAITIAASDITALSTDLGTAETGIASNASAITALNASVSQSDGDIDANASALISLNAATGNNVANARFGMLAATTPADAIARIGMRVAASGGGSLSEAGLYLDALTGGGSRIVVAADKFVIQGSLNSKFAPFIIDNNVVYMDKARIRELTADNFDNNSGISLGGKGSQNQTQTAQTSFVNITGMSGLTRDFDEDGVALIIFQLGCWVNNSNRIIEVIGTTTDASNNTRNLTSGPLTFHHFNANDRPVMLTGIAIKDFSAGIHTFDLQWRVQGGSATAFATVRRLMICHFKGSSFSGLNGNTNQGGGSGGGGGNWNVLP